MLGKFLLISLISISYQANIDVCNSLGSIFDRDGNYLKKVCEVHRLHNHDLSESFCRQNGMELFMIENDEVFESLVSYMNRTWLVTVPPVYWDDNHGLRINGRRNNAGQWFMFGQKKMPLPSNLPWFVNSEYGDSCLTIKRDGNFRISGYKCERVYFFLCELEAVNEYNYNVYDDNYDNNNCE